MQNQNDSFFRDIINNIPGFVYQLKIKCDASTEWSYISPTGIQMLNDKSDRIYQGNIGERIELRIVRTYFA